MCKLIEGWGGSVWRVGWERVEGGVEGGVEGKDSTAGQHSRTAQQGSRVQVSDGIATFC
jgi:hypothetical protein